MIRWLALAALIALAAAALWVRLAPTDPARWHTDPLQGTAGLNSFVAKAADPRPPAEALARLDEIALATPRTMRLSGSPQDGRITWITRSAIWGFPDFTTVQALQDGQGTSLVIHARSRFGVSDMGVNRARVTDWLDRLAP